MSLKTKLKFRDFMVVIDTNCFENYSNNKEILPYCAKNESDTFFKSKKARDGITMGHYYITESVFREVIQQRKEYCNQSLENLERALKPFCLSVENIKNISKNDLFLGLEKSLRKYLADYCIDILPHPNNDVFPRIIQRALDKKLPFKVINKCSDKGFKDVLLWETLLNFNYEKQSIGKVFLITANSKDFPLEDLSYEWNEFHPYVELKIVSDWKDFELEEQIILPELIAQNNISYSRVLEMFQDEDPNIVELPNFNKKVTGRKDSFVVEIGTDIKRKDGTIGTDKYFYDIRINEPTLIDPDDNYNTN
ncbi:MAG: DUF4935 domain-containing protein [Alphaproteobacteria bacterium]|nr:DUF4935 domain-containing protein [Alphaproteobacteria bacterium]